MSDYKELDLPVAKLGNDSIYDKDEDVTDKTYSFSESGMTKHFHMTIAKTLISCFKLSKCSSIFLKANIIVILNNFSLVITFVHFNICTL